VIIDQISIASQEDKGLNLNLHLKTLFRDAQQQPQAAPTGQSL